MLSRFILIACLFGLFFSCSKVKDNQTTIPAPSWPIKAENKFIWDTALTKAVYYDKLLGALVGSAIGDAMGAPTEMWHRDRIRSEWGYVSNFDDVIRPGDAEGPWEDNLPPGSTTDDTRWKYLLGNFLADKQHGADLDAKVFAQFIEQTYLTEVNQVKDAIGLDPEPLEVRLRHMAFLQEWAKVAQPYAANNAEAYGKALAKFYGGEMSCAGMLYAPVLGAFYPSHPDQAYVQAYKLGIFDIGYARDITGLTAALVSQAMKPGATLEEITQVCRTVDPERYANSRLVGRISLNIFNTAKNIAYTAKLIDKVNNKAVRRFGASTRDPLFLTQLDSAYLQLDRKLQDIPFHAGEIHLINLTALFFSEGDFQKALEFVVNYGRDNDTVGAVTGAILGARLGFKGLPQDLAQKAMLTNRNTIGLDLEKIARKMAH
jgi:hypothetical protein